MQTKNKGKVHWIVALAQTESVNFRLLSTNVIITKKELFVNFHESPWSSWGDVKDIFGFNKPNRSAVPNLKSIEYLQQIS